MRAQQLAAATVAAAFVSVRQWLKVAGGESWWLIPTDCCLHHFDAPFWCHYVRPTNAPLGAVELKRWTHPFMVRPYSTPTCTESHEPWQVTAAVATVRTTKGEKIVLVSKKWGLLVAN
ncbi:hypothetical protein Tco_1270341 [Tanacetum coccineum]